MVYGVFALGPRRAIFADLATEPASVTRDAASRSDNLNLVLFLLAVLATVAAAVLTGIVLSKLRRVESARVAVGLPWWLLTGAAFAAVAVALGLHVSTDPDQIVVGYIILGIGALLVAVSAIWAAVRIRGSTRDNTTAGASAPA